MTELLTEFCNIFGAESGGARILGGLSRQRVATQWFCDHRAVGHFYMVCEHGHRGQMMPLCMKHYTMYKGGKVQFCPRCNELPPGHRCPLKLEHVS